MPTVDKDMRDFVSDFNSMESNSESNSVERNSDSNSIYGNSNSIPIQILAIPIQFQFRSDWEKPIQFQFQFRNWNWQANPIPDRNLPQLCQIQEAYSKWHLTKVLYSGVKFAVFSVMNDLLITAIMLLALLIFICICLSNSSFGSIITPISVSSTVNPNSYELSPVFSSYITLLLTAVAPLHLSWLAPAGGFAWGWALALGLAKRRTGRDKNTRVHTRTHGFTRVHAGSRGLTRVNARTCPNAF